MVESATVPVRGTATGKERWNFDHEISLCRFSRDRGWECRRGPPTVVRPGGPRHGKEAWRTRTDSNALPSPAVAGDVVVLGDAMGNILGFDLATGRELWRVVTGDAIHSSPLVRDGRVFIGSDDGKLYALAGDLAAPARKAFRASIATRGPYSVLNVARSCGTRWCGGLQL